MGKLLDNMPQSAAATTVLMGAMLFGASVTYAYHAVGVSTVAFAQEVCGGLPCDAEDPDDCGTACHCVDAEKICFENPIPPGF